MNTFRSLTCWRSIVRAKKLDEETQAHMTEMKVFSIKMQQAHVHYERSLLRKYVCKRASSRSDS
jgi:hypothetical protein